MASYQPLVPATLAFNEAGIPYSPDYRDVYHSEDGGLAQSRQVFLAGNGLPRRWADRDSFVILETGFGLGLNFLAAWQAWRADPRRPRRLHFVSIEKHPFSAEDLARVQAMWPELADISLEVRRSWPTLTPGAHRLSFDGGQVVLTLFFGDAANLVKKLRLRADAVFLDGFAPARNPDLWNTHLLKALSRHCAPGASLATWSVARGVCEALEACGWQLEKRPGFGHKREMLVARLRGESAPLQPAGRRAAVIGAGLAGAAAAERLAARGFEVVVLERHAEPAAEASGNPVGLLHPMMARDDNIAARFSRAGYLHALRLLDQLGAVDNGLRWRSCGVLQLARDVEQENAQREVCEGLAFPSDYVRFLDRATAQALSSQNLAAGGWFYPQAGWVSPPTFCRALLARHPGRVQTRCGVAISYIRVSGDIWQLYDQEGNCVLSADLVVLANAHAANRLLADAPLPLSRLRGQLTYLPGGTLPGLHHVLCGNGYVAPEVSGAHCLGATYDFNDEDPAPRLDGHLANLAHLSALLPGTSHPDPGTLAGRVAFRTMTTDRMPIVGPLPGQPLFLRREAGLREVNRIPGLHALLGLGSRGLVWAPLAAELLVARLTGEPLPVEGDLADAVDPARFALRARRREPA